MQRTTCLIHMNIIHMLLWALRFFAYAFWSFKNQIIMFCSDLVISIRMKYIVHHFIVNSKYSLLNYISNPLIGVVVSILVILLTAVVLNIINNSLHDIFYKRIKRRQTLE